MKKIELCLIIVTLVVLSLVVSGCEESRIETNPFESARGALLVPNEKGQKDWLDKYGDGEESVEMFNFAILLWLNDQQAAVIKQLDERLVVLEDPNNILAERVRKLEETQPEVVKTLRTRMDVFAESLDGYWADANLPCKHIGIDPNE